MNAPTVYLASTSPARLALLRSSGIEPIIVPSHVDEDAVVREAEIVKGRPLTTPEVVYLLARTKAEAVVDTAVDGAPIDGFIVGGDSAFLLDGVTYGKPHVDAVARERWLTQRGQAGVLHSGHWVIDRRRYSSVGASGVGTAAAGAVHTATVTFAADISDLELDAYILSGEPLAVAGAFTIDSLGAAFIDHIDGDPSTVVGLSIPGLRRTFAELGVTWTDLWNRASRAAH